MSENVEKRRSKWDLPSEISCPTKSRETMQPESGGDPHQCLLHLGSSSKHAGYPSESGPRPKSSSNDNPEMPLYQIEMEIDKKDGLSREPISVSRNDLKDCVVDRSGNSKYSDIEVGGRNRVSREASSSSHSRRMDNGGPDPAISQSYKTNFSPGRDSWRRRSRSKSPRNGRSRPRRGQSRSRSRSRSPYYGIRREAEGWKERGRFGPKGSPPLCRDFVVGRCRKGSQCRYPHEDGGRIRRQYTDIVDTRENRHESGRYTQHGSEGHFSDSLERRDHSKLPYRHDNFHKEDREDRDFQRNGKSTERCLNFMSGKCQKGATCRYVHHEVSHGGEYFANSGSRERDYDRGDRDVPPRHEQRRDPLRSSDTPCKFFLEGRCRNGGNCKFSHLGEVPSHSHGRHEDDRRWRNWPNESWSTRDGSTHPQHSQSENHVDVKYENLLGNIHGEVPSHSDIRHDDDMREHNWHSENWLTRDPSTHTRHSQSEDPVVDANFKILSGDIHGIVSAAHIQNTPNEPAKQPDLQGSFLSSQQDPVMDRGMVPRQEEKLSVSSESQKDVNFFEMEKPSLAILPEQSCSQFDKSQYAVPQAPILQTINTLEQPQHIAPPTSFNDPSQQQAFYPPISNLQCQSATSLHSSNVQSANFCVQNQQFPLSTEESQKNHYIMPSNVQVPYAEKQCGVVLNLNTNNQTPQVPYPTNSHMTKVRTVESTAKQDVLETKAPNSLSGSLINNKVVTSDQMAQLTNLSASLAQIFGNSQQLPELYAALNPSSATRISLSQSTTEIVPTAASKPLIQQPPSVNPTSLVPIAQMGGCSWSAQPYDPMTDSMEPNKVATGNLSLGYLLKADQQKDALIPHSILTQTPYLDKDVPKNVGGINTIDNLDGNKEKANHEQVDMAGSMSDRMNGVPKNVENETNDHDTKTEKVSADAKTDEENKKNKDVKVIKIFKNALVEFVKELLKPTWKEGNMSKEAHKTVVKKVVDKVTGTLQANIPSTQEKIDQYLSHSKPKLSKLVQAYVEKFSKT